MGVMEYIGLGLILLFVFGSAYFFLNKKQIENNRIVWLAIIGIFAGCIFLFYNRIEILEVFKIGKIKTWVKKAETDANAISNIRKEVENTKEAISLVVRNINDARNQLKRLDQFSEDAQIKLDDLKSKSENANEQINNLIHFSNQASNLLSNIQEVQKKANKELTDIKSTADFMMLISRAINDDRSAVDEIFKISSDKNHTFHKVAKNAIQEILIETNPMITIRIHPKYPWKMDGIDPQKLSYEEYVAIYKRVIPFYKPGIINEIWSAERFSKYQKLSFLVDVIKSDNSVRAAEYASRLVNMEAHTGKNFLDRDSFVKWFQENEVRLKAD